MTETVMHLMYDVEEAFESRTGKVFTYRVRVWCGSNLPSVVLVSQIYPKEQPWILSSKVANWVNCGVLGYPKRKPHYFESQMRTDKPSIFTDTLSRVAFGYFGKSGDRARLIDPVSIPVDWIELSSLLGFDPGY